MWRNSRVQKLTLIYAQVDFVCVTQLGLKERGQFYIGNFFPPKHLSIIILRSVTLRKTLHDKQFKISAESPINSCLLLPLTSLLSLRGTETLTRLPRFANVNIFFTVNKTSLGGTSAAFLLMKHKPKARQLSVIPGLNRNRVQLFSRG